MNKIYVLTGSSGIEDYDSDWLVKAFTDKASAEKYSELCEAEYKRIADIIYEKEDQHYIQDQQYEEHNIERNRYDPAMKYDYCSVYYAIKEVELCSEVLV